MDRNQLIGLQVLSKLLVDVLDEVGADSLSSPQLVEQLRELGNRAAVRLDQLSSLPRE